MDDIAKLLGENLPKVLTGVATTGVIVLVTCLYRAGSWTKDHRRARLFEVQGDKFFSHAMITSAIEQYKAANKIWEQEVNHAKMLTIYHKIGRAYGKIGDSEQALEALTHCEMLWEALKKDVKMYDIYFELAQIHLAKRNWERASFYVGLAIEMLRAQQSPRLPIALSVAARIARERGRPEEAESLYIEAIELLDNISDTLGLASVYYELGDLKGAQQRRDLADGYYRKSAQAYDKLGSARAGEIRSKLDAPAYASA